MQNVMHIATISGHIAQNDGRTMQNDSRTTCNVGSITLNVSQGTKGGLRSPQGPQVLHIRKLNEAFRKIIFIC